MASSPAAIAALAVSLMWRNCASRWGWLLPSRVLLLAWQLYFRSRSRSATTRWLAGLSHIRKQLEEEWPIPSCEVHLTGDGAWQRVRTQDVQCHASNDR